MADKAGFSATDAALTGFEITRREPLTVLAWSAVQGVVLIPLSLAFASAMAPYQGRLQASGGKDPAVAAAMLSHVLPLQLLSAVLLTVLFAVLYGAVYRTVLRPQATGLGRLRLGAEELRVAGALVLLGLITVGVAIAAAIVAVVLVGVLSAAAPALRALWAVAAVVGVLGALVFVSVRLSLAPPLTFDTGRVDVTGSWRLTRGRFWALFGSYLVAGLLAVIVELAVLAVFVMLALPVVGLPGVQALFDPRVQGPSGAPMALAVAFQVVGALLSGFATALLAGAPASAYAQLTGARGAAPTTAGAPGSAPPRSDLPRFGR